MKKQFLLFFALICTLLVSAQTKTGWDIQVGATVAAPLAKNIGWNSKAFGQRVNFSKGNFNAQFGFMQDKAGFVRMPALVGVRKHLKRNLHVGLDGGVTFFNGQKGQLSYAPSIGYRINKKWCLEQSILRTVKDGKHSSLATLGVLYHL